MRLLVIGGSGAGISASLAAREHNPSAEVTLLVADQYPNFSICGIGIAAVKRYAEEFLGPTEAARLSSLRTKDVTFEELWHPRRAGAGRGGEARGLPSGQSGLRPQRPGGSI